MRLALISDLHASLDALDVVLADIDRMGVDRIVCLGDIVDLGPQPRETVARLWERGIPCIRGNHDALDEHPAFELLAAVEDWTRATLTEAERSWLLGLPMEHVEDLDGLTVLCSHASPRNVTDQVLSTTPATTLESWWGDRDFDVLVCGHTHLPVLRRVDRRLVVNVGSVGQPFLRAFDGNPPVVLKWSEYAIVSHEAGCVSVEHRRLQFDLSAFERALRASSFPQPDAWMRQWSNR